jgi:hypothetical protein
MEAPVWLITVLAIATGFCAGKTAWLAHQLKHEMRALTGDTREETVRRIRAQMLAMRQAYQIKPHDRFAIEMEETLDRLERTMNRLEAEEWKAVRA